MAERIVQIGPLRPGEKQQVLTGPPGPQGPPGDDGEPGQGLRIVGYVETNTQLPNPLVYEGELGDIYITLDDGHGWFWDPDAGWIDVGPLQGPEGPEGPAGPPAGTEAELVEYHLVATAGQIRFDVPIFHAVRMTVNGVVYSETMYDAAEDHIRLKNQFASVEGDEVTILTYMPTNQKPFSGETIYTTDVLLPNPVVIPDTKSVLHTQSDANYAIVDYLTRLDEDIQDIKETQDPEWEIGEWISVDHTREVSGDERLTAGDMQIGTTGTTWSNLNSILLGHPDHNGKDFTEEEFNKAFQVGTYVNMENQSNGEWFRKKITNTAYNASTMYVYFDSHVDAEWFGNVNPDQKTWTAWPGHLVVIGGMLHGQEHDHDGLYAPKDHTHTGPDFQSESGVYTALPPETDAITFVIDKDDTFVAGLTQERCLFYLNGTMLVPTTDYSIGYVPATDTDDHRVTVTLTESSNQGDVWTLHILPAINGSSYTVEV